MYAALKRKVGFGDIPHLRLAPFAVILGASLLFLAPILLLGIPNNADDAWAHSRWQKLFALQLWHGEAYPRWLDGLNDGFGSPAFFFYPPLAHFFSAIFYPLFPEPFGFSTRLALGMFAAFYVSGIGAYCWTNELVHHKKSATVGALFYLAAPYHLFVDTYLRTAVAELWAFSWAPWTLFSIHLMKSKPTRGIAGCALSVAALLFSHAPSSVFLIPTFVVYAACVAKQERQAGIFFRAAISIALACLISAIYLATALTHTQYIRTEALFSGYYDIFKWFFFNAARWPNLITENAILRVAVPQNLAALALAIGSFAVLKAGKVRFYAGLALVGVACVLFLMSKASIPLWRAVPLIQKIQFPWRLLLLQSIFLAALAATCAHGIAAMSRRERRRSMLTGAIAALFIGLLAENLVLTIHAKPQFAWSKAQLDNKDAPEYVLGDIAEAAALFPGGADVAVTGGQGTATLTRISSRRLAIDIDASVPVRVLIRQFAYPGWQYTLDRDSTRHPIGALSKEQPVLAMDVGPGHHRAELCLSRTSSENAGILLSLTGLLGLVLFVWADMRGRKKTSQTIRGFRKTGTDAARNESDFESRSRY
jgi:hypothetical protein